MKVRVIDRILILFYGLIGLFMIVSEALGFAWKEILLDKAAQLMAPAFVKASVYAVLAFFALYTLYIVWFALHTVKEKEHYVSVANSDNGTTRVSVAALNQLVAHTADIVPGVQDVKTTVYDDNDVVKVAMQMNVTGSVNIPEASMQIKDAVRSRMETVSGIHVRDIDITVGRIFPTDETPVPVTQPAAPAPVMDVQADSWMPVEDISETEETESPAEIPETPENEAE